MRAIFRRLRGLLGTAASWGLAWFGAAALFFGARTLGLSSLGMVLSVSAGVGAAGFIAGAGFSVVLSIAERRKSIGDLSLGRFAVWGCLGSILAGGPLLLGLPSAELLAALAMLGTLGAASSSVTLALARSAKSAEQIEAGRSYTPSIPGPQ